MLPCAFGRAYSRTWLSFNLYTEKNKLPDLKNWQILPVLVFKSSGLCLDPTGGNHSYVRRRWYLSVSR